MGVEFDQASGEVRACGLRAPCVADGPGAAVRLGGPGGPLLRPVTFGERSSAAGDALTAGAGRGRAALRRALRERSTVEPGVLEDGTPAARLLDCVVLALAGAEREGAPPFADAALAVMCATGTTMPALLDAPAREVDRLAGAGGGKDGGWTRFVLAGEPAGEPSVEELCDRLADALLARAESAPAGSAGEPAAPLESAAPAPRPAGAPRASRPPRAPRASRAPAAGVVAAGEAARRDTGGRTAARSLLAPGGAAALAPEIARGALRAAATATAARAAPPRPSGPGGRVTWRVTARGAARAGTPGALLRVAGVTGHTAPDGRSRVRPDAAAPSIAPAALAPAALAPATVPPAAPAIAAARAASPPLPVRVSAPVAVPAPAGAGGAAATVAPAPGVTWHAPARTAAAGAAAPAGAAPHPATAPAGAPPAWAAPAALPLAVARDRDDAVWTDVADALAAALQDEADLRGLAR